MALIKAAYIEQQTPKPTPRKRKRTADKPTDDMSCVAGRPTRENTLIKIANEDTEKDTTAITSQYLILLTGAGTGKKKKTILTKYGSDIKCTASKHYISYEFIGELRKKALETIKEQRDIINNLNTIESLIEPQVKNNQKL